MGYKEYYTNSEESDLLAKARTSLKKQNEWDGKDRHGADVG